MDVSCLFKNTLFIAALILAGCLSLLNTPVLPIDQLFAQEAIVLQSPKEGELIISKKPDINCSFSVPFLKESLYIAVDQTDMTALATVTEQGFTLTPFHVLPPGTHKVLVTFVDENNAVYTKEFEFRTRHSEAFEQASTTNKVSFTYSQLIDKRDDAKNRSLSDWELETNLNSQSMISEGPWEVSFTTNARYTDQQLETTDPLEKGLTLVDYMVKGKYDMGELALNAALGDVTVEGTRNTISSLSRKGATIGAESDNFFVTGFSLRTRQVFGLEDGQDAEPDTSDHLVGITGGGSLLDEKINFKTIYVNGGEQTNASSYGVWPNSAGTKGEAAGLEITTDFFDQKMTTLFEYGISDYDADTGDTADSISDKAYLGKIDGVLGFFNYDLLYEYTGPDYKVPTSSLQQDREGVSANTGFSFDTQSIQFNFGKYHDNLDDRPSVARIETLEYGAAYNLNKLPAVPMSLGWQRSLQDSSNEPAGTSEIKNTTDTVFGSISYMKDMWVIGLQPQYARTDDETSVNYDTASKSITVFSSYNKENFSISPSISFNRFEDFSTNVEQDTLNYNLSFSIHLYEGLDLEGTGSYGKVDSSSNTVDQDNFNGDLQLSYRFAKPVFGTFSPSLLLRATHDNTNDNAADTSTKETIVYLILSGSFDLSY